MPIHSNRTKHKKMHPFYSTIYKLKAFLFWTWTGLDLAYSFGLALEKWKLFVKYNIQAGVVNFRKALVRKWNGKVE